MNEFEWMRALVGPELEDEDVRYLLGRMERVGGEAGSTLVARGSWSDSLYLLASGRLRASVEENGRRLDVGVIEPGHWIGEMHFVDPGPCSATVTAETDYVALRLAGESLDALIDENARAAGALLRALTRDVAERLVATSAGVIERIGENEFRVGDAGEKGSWFDQLVVRIFGRDGAR